MTGDNDEARRIAEAVRDAGLERLMEQEPELVARAWRLARTYGDLLGRPDAPQREPAHVYLREPLIDS